MGLQRWVVAVVAEMEKASQKDYHRQVEVVQEVQEAEENQVSPDLGIQVVDPLVVGRLDAGGDG